MNENETKDAKTVADSSTTTTAPSAAPKGDKVASPPTVPTLGDAITDALKDEQTVEEQLPATTPETEETPAAETDVPKASAEGEKKAEEELPPFHEHPRWKEVQEQLKAAKTEIETVKPQAEVAQRLQQYLESNRISPELFNEAMSLTAQMVASPKEALTRLRALTQQLEESLGDRLPDDLADEVEKGALTLSRAKEIAELRQSQRTTKLQTTSMQEQQRQAQVKTFVDTLNTWGSTKSATDPDFRPKKDGEPDGKYEFVEQRMRAAFATSAPQTVNDVVKVAEDAYNAVNAAFSRFTARQPVRKSPLPSGKSSAAATAAQPKTLLEAVELSLAEK